MSAAGEVVKACADQREATRPQFTIANAIEEGQWLRRTPDGIIAPELAKRTILTLLSALESSRCFFNAVQRGQEVFVLVQQDRAAPAAIEVWALDAGRHGCKSGKVEDAMQTAHRWRSLQPHMTKWPD